MGLVECTERCIFIDVFDFQCCNSFTRILRSFIQNYCFNFVYCTNLDQLVESWIIYHSTNIILFKRLNAKVIDIYLKLMAQYLHIEISLSSQRSVFIFLCTIIASLYPGITCLFTCNFLISRCLLRLSTFVCAVLSSSFTTSASSNVVVVILNLRLYWLGDNRGWGSLTQQPMTSWLL